MSLLEDESFLTDLDSNLSSRAIAEMHGIKSKSTVNEYRAKRRAQIAAAAIEGEGVGYEYTNANGVINLKTPKTREPQDENDAIAIFRAKGLNPDDYVISYTFKEWDAQRKGGEVIVLHSAGAHGQPKVAGAGGEPLWPVVQPAAPVAVTPAAPIVSIPRVDGFKVAAKCADHQMGFRALPDGTFDSFHDEKAMALFVIVCAQLQPDKIHVLGDFLDLPQQSRWAQEASFARTTQMALDAAHQWLAELRAACPNSEIIVIEGNHDKRMQNFMETNALAAFGLRRAALPGSWPVMSLPNLLRLDDLNVRYIDAYPAATDWDNADTRNIHGTRANSNGSTMAQYVNDLPHINTWAGHTHRAEIIHHTGIGSFGQAIESYGANPGCMCKTDGSVPSVKGAIGADGVPVKVVEDWQQGFGVLYYNDTESWPQVYRIRNGSTFFDGRLIAV